MQLPVFIRNSHSSLNSHTVIPFPPAITIQNALPLKIDFLDRVLMKFKDIGITKNKRKTKLIVSFTSYPARIYYLPYVVYSLLIQSVKPDKLILWLAKEQFPNLENDLPQSLLKLKNNGLTIKWCRDIKSYKKLIPAVTRIS